tara:strand:+ start:484 stop:4788 length:4305 start_codon:yes stop_codon:yes gene_type:complete
MDRRPPNPRRLSRRLFKDKPSITPVDTGKTPKYLLGKEVKRTPLRSDIKSITVREGEDFVTYPLWKRGRAEGKIQWSGGSKYEDYLQWRDEAELTDEIYVGRTVARDRVVVTEEGDKDIEDYREKPTKQEKKEFGERARDVAEEMVEDVYSLSAGDSKQIAKQLLDKRKSMSRAQQRKLGRVIRDGKTNPIPRFREDKEKIDELHQDEVTYDVGDIQHIKPVKGVVEYYELKPEFRGVEDKLDDKYESHFRNIGRLFKDDIKLAKERGQLYESVRSAGLAKNQKVKTLLHDIIERESGANTKKRISADKFKALGMPTKRWKGDGDEWGKMIDFSKQHKIKLFGWDNPEWDDKSDRQQLDDTWSHMREHQRVKKIPSALRKYLDNVVDAEKEVVKELPFLTPEDRKRMVREISDLKEVKALRASENPLAKKLEKKSEVWGKDKYRKGVYAKSPTELVADDIAFGEKLEKRYTKQSIPFVGKADLKKKLVELEDKEYTLHPEMLGDSSKARDVRRTLAWQLVNYIGDPDERRITTSVRVPRTPKYNWKDGKSFSQTYFDEGIVKAADKEDLPLFTATLADGGRRKFREKLITMDEDWEKHPDYGGKGADISFYKEGQIDPKFLVSGKGNFKDAMNVKKIKKVKKETKKYGKYNSKLEDKLDENYGWTKRGKQLLRTKYSRRYDGEPKQRYKVVRTRLGSSALGNPDFQLRVARGGGRRIFHTAEAKTKGWKEVSKNQFTKQAENWKALDVDSTPASQLQLRGLRDRRTGGGRLLGRGIPNPRRMDRSKEYRSARNEALIQMRINESATVKDIRRSEAVKALNLKLAKETAEKTAEGLKAKNAGLTHSYNVNVRNQTAATLIGSSPDELKKIVKKGGGLSLIKTMIRKGEISDISVLTGLADIDPATIVPPNPRTGHKGNPKGSSYISRKQMDALVRLFNEGGEFVEGQEYFFKHRGEFGELENLRGYLEKGGERRDNLMLFRILPSGERQRYLVKKGDILPLDDHTSTTASGKRQPLTEPRQMSMTEFDLFGEDPDGNVIDYTRRGEEIIQDPKTGVKSLVAARGAELDEPTPRQQTVLESLRSDEDFDLHGAPAPIGLHLEAESPSSEEAFEFGGDAPTSPPFRPAPQPEPEAALDLEDVDDALEVVMSGERHAPLNVGGYETGEGTEIARVLGRQRSEEAEEKAEDIIGEIEDELALEGLAPTPRQSAEAQAIIDSPLSLPEKEAKLAELKDKLAKEVSILRTMSEKSPKPKKPPKSPKKEVSFAEVKPEGDKLFDKKEARTYTPSAVDSSWEKFVDVVPDELLREDWDFTGRGGKGLTLQSRLGEGGSQEVPDGFIALYTTKHAPLGKQVALVVNEGDLYYLLRGIHKVPIRNDKGRENPITENTLRTFFKDVIVDLRNGKKDKAFNNKQLLRALEMIPAAPESDEDTDEDET